MQNSGNRIPRWLVENDPTWEKSIDSHLGMLKWTKKGTGIQAVCHPTSMFCDIVGQDEQAGLSDIFSMTRMHRHQAARASGASDITKYLSSRYLNPDINGPRFDLRKFRRS
ncbi:MAG TPA: hypothetical protein VF172_08535 [Nitrososphaera sp.]|jgi:hypothetical protein